MILGLAALETFAEETAWPFMLLTHLPHFPLFLFALGAFIPAVLERKVVAFLCGSAGLLLLLHLEGFAWRLPKSHVQPKTGLRIMTFNIQKGEARRLDVSRQLAAQRPDIVCLQEASIVQSDAKGEPIRQALADYHWVFERGVAIASRWPIRRTWSPRHRVESHGWAVFAELVMPSGVVLTVGSVHLSPVHWDRFLSAEVLKLPEHLRLAAKARARQAEALFEEIDRLSPDAPVIVCGDFNGPPRGGLYRKFTSKLHDAHASSGSGFGWTIPSAFPVSRLDYAFFRGILVKCARVLPKSGSDHCAMELAADLP